MWLRLNASGMSPMRAVLARRRREGGLCAVLGVDRSPVARRADNATSSALISLPSPSSSSLLPLLSILLTHRNGSRRRSHYLAFSISAQIRFTPHQRVICQGIGTSRWCQLSSLLPFFVLQDSSPVLRRSARPPSFEMARSCRTLGAGWGCLNSLLYLFPSFLLHHLACGTTHLACGSSEPGQASSLRTVD